MTKSTEKTNVYVYKISTALFCVFMMGSAIPNIFMSELSIEGFASIGLPAYLPLFLGIAKALGVIGILLPGFPRLREWAYAGLIFDLIGALYCIAAAGKQVSDWAGVLLPITIGFVSYLYYHKKNRITN